MTNPQPGQTPATPEAPAEAEPQPFLPADPLAAATVTLLRERFADDVLDVVEERGETTVRVRAEAIERICRALRDAPALQYNFLSNVTAVDWPERDPRFDVVYHLLSLSTRARVRLKARVGDEDTPEPELPTVSTVWPAANWYEREVYDLFGVRFTGHPDLERILMPPDWTGHPLRKDYPLTGITLPDPHWGGQVPFDQPLPEGTGRLTLRSRDGVEPLPEAGEGQPGSGA